MKITRTRWVMTKNNQSEIFCGLARNFKFKPVNDIGDTSVKTYLSRNKAISAFQSSWRTKYDDDVYRAIEVTETIIDKRDYEKSNS